MNVKLEYLEKEFSAKISTDICTNGWHELRRAFELTTDDTENLNEKEFKVPWITFINLIPDLRYYLKVYHFSFKAVGMAKILLQKNVTDRNAYEYAISQNIQPENVQETLTACGFKRNLTNEQIRNLKKILNLSAAATFSVPGAGKTTEALAYFQFNRESTSKLLIVAPKNAFPAWDEQILECIEPPEKVIRLVGTNKNVEKKLTGDPLLCIITYHKLVNCLPTIEHFFSTGSSNFMFLDESHKIKKGSQGELGNAVLKIAHLPDRKLIMTGTPMPNDEYDINSQFKFLYPSIKMQNTAIELIKPIFVRTTKAELKLPEIKRVSMPIEMTQRQRELYNLLTKKLLISHQINMNSSQKQFLRTFGKSVMRLIQLASNPALLLNSNIAEYNLLKDILLEGDSPKLEYVCNRARYLVRQEKKVLIWSSFVQNVELIAMRLQDMGAEYIHGGVDTGSEEEDNTREGKIRKFHDNKNCNVLVANPAACAEGISLHAVCHNAIYLDRTFNAAQYLQSEDRIHRYGLKEGQTTIIEIVKCKNSIDDAIEKRLEEKVQLMSQVLHDGGLNISPIDINDIENDSLLDQEDMQLILSEIENELK